MPRTKIDRSQYEKIERLYFEDRQSQTTIAKAYDCSHACIGQILKKISDRPCRIGGGNFSPIEHQERIKVVSAGLNRGLSVKQIAKNLGVSSNSAIEFIARYKLGSIDPNLSVAGHPIVTEDEKQQLRVTFLAAAVLVADHGECGCHQCQAAALVLSTAIPSEMVGIANLISNTINKYREREAEQDRRMTAEYAEFLIEESFSPSWVNIDIHVASEEIPADVNPVRARARTKISTARMQLLRSEGKSDVEIAEIAAISKQRVHQLLGKRDPKLIKTRTQSVIEQFNTDRTARQIAKDYGICFLTVYSIWKKAGLSPKDRKCRKKRAERKTSIDVDVELNKTYGLWRIVRQVWLNVETKDYSSVKESIGLPLRSPYFWYECECQGCLVKQAVMRSQLLHGKTQGCKKCRSKSIAKMSKSQMLALRSAGESDAQIAKHAAISRQRVSQILGAKRNAEDERIQREKKNQQVTALFDSNLTVSQIASDTGIYGNYIYYIWRQAGLVLADRGVDRKLAEAKPMAAEYGLWKVLQRVWVERSTREYSVDRNSIDIRYRDSGIFFECECKKCHIKKAVSKRNLMTGLSKSCMKCAPKIRRKQSCEQRAEK